MTRIGVIGLGNMGIGLAKNLLKNGYDVQGYDLSSERIDALMTLGGKPASLSDVAMECDAIFIIQTAGETVK